MSQQQKIMNHLQRFGTITAMEAMNYYGIMRLGARIWDLKHAGNTIMTEREQAPNRYGELTTYARYRLVKNA